jgi:hypothetical protein
MPDYGHDLVFGTFDVATADRLLPFALEDGVSTFIVWADDPRAIEV